MMNYDVGFVPSKDLLSLQKAELDILKEFQRVCEKHHIRYFAEGGTLLGAVRHNGFIPWDDDVDVQMTWEDFVKFKEVAIQELQYPFSFQDYTTDKFFDISPMARIRNVQTTGCTKWEYDNVNDPSYNRGVFIDIWVLFPIPALEYRDEIKQRIDGLWRAIRGWYAEENENNGRISAYHKYLPYWQEVKKNYTIIDLKDQYIDSCKWDGDFCEYGMTSFRTFNSLLMWDKQWFDNVVYLPFEDTTISCPNGYSEILTKTYGDWKIPVFDGAIHEMVICDVNIPYSERMEFCKSK